MGHKAWEIELKYRHSRSISCSQFTRSALPDVTSYQRSQPLSNDEQLTPFYRKDLKRYTFKTKHFCCPRTTGFK